MKNSAVEHSSVTGGQYLSHPHALLGKAWQQLQRWWDLAEQRRKLALLDEHALKDLGLSRTAALHESRRSFRDDPLAGSRLSS